MSNLFLTLVIAFVIIVFAIALLAIGWLITGKTKIEKQCGRDPTKKRRRVATLVKYALILTILKETHSNHEQSSPTTTSSPAEDDKHVS